MRRNIIKISVLILILISMSAFLTGCSKESDEMNEADIQRTEILAGTVEGLTEKSITVKDVFGRTYLFARDDSLISSESAGSLSTGETIYVTYTGNLKKSDDLQTVRVLRFYLEQSIGLSSPVHVSSGHSSVSALLGKETYKKAKEILDSMTEEEKVAQMFIVRCPDTAAKDVALKYQFGGYILFARDFKERDKQQMAAAIQEYQDVSKRPMFIGVDEEGGTVNRISLYKQYREVPFWSPRDLFDEGGMELIKSDTKEKCRLLSSLGINLNFAPVADISSDPADYMYPRTFGISAEETCKYVENVVSVMKENGIGSVLKHFPGYGNNSDTHTGIAVDERSLKSLRENDFLPFESGIEAGAEVVLVSHNIVRSIDGEHPASLSLQVHNILRDEIGFSGLIITDDLYMDAIREYTHGQEAAVMAVLAGNDLLCCSDYQAQYPAVVQALKDGKISENRVDESVMRILQYKISMGLMN